MDYFSNLARLGQVGNFVIERESQCVQEILNSGLPRIPDSAELSGFLGCSQVHFFIEPKRFDFQTICVRHCGPEILKKVQANKLVKSNKSFFFLRENAFLAVLNFFPVQKLFFFAIFEIAKNGIWSN